MKIGNCANEIDKSFVKIATARTPPGFEKRIDILDAFLAEREVDVIPEPQLPSPFPSRLTKHTSLHDATDYLRLSTGQ